MDNITITNDIAFQNLLKELGFDKLPQNQQKEFLNKISEVALKRLFIETLEKLDEDGREKYQQLVEQGTDPQTMEQFLNAHIPNYSQFAQKVLANLVEEFNADFKQS